MSPRLLLIATVLALFTALVFAIFIAWSNAASRNLALATGALGGAMLLFLVQLPFELRGSTEKTFFTAEYTIDRQKPGIRQWRYTLEHPGWRLPAETSASDRLAVQNPSAFSADRQKLSQDLVVYSLLYYLAHEQFDWQMKRVTFAGNSMGRLTQFARISSPRDCTEYRPEMLASLLKAAGNVFAGAPISVISGAICLPPDTKLSVGFDSLVLTNSFCQISLKLRPSGSISYMQPGTGGDVPKLPNGEARYETYLTGVEAEITYSGLRTQHRDAAQYRQWAERVVNGARVWFEGEPTKDAAGN